jgi:Ca2+-binding RTX toxin-like protein
MPVGSRRQEKELLDHKLRERWVRVTFIRTMIWWNQPREDGMRKHLKGALLILVTFALTLSWVTVFVGSPGAAEAAVPGRNGSSASVSNPQEWKERMSKRPFPSTLSNGLLMSKLRGGPAGSTPGRQCFGHKVTIVGTTGDDRLRGTQGPDVIAGLGGDDHIIGRGGGDYICAGRGQNSVRGGKGPDQISIPEGHAKGNGGADQIYGGPHATVGGGAGPDFLVGTGVVRGGRGVDQIYGDSGSQTLFGGRGGDFISGENPDSIRGGSDLIYGGRGNDTLLGDGDECSNRDDVLHGGPGDDTMLGDGTIYCGSGDDVLYGGAGHDVMYGDAIDQFLGDTTTPSHGNDILRGGKGPDKLFGDQEPRAQDRKNVGADQLYGGLGNDLLKGQGRNDLSVGGPGDDKLDGGRGINVNNGGLGTDACIRPDSSGGAVNCES